MTESIAYKLNIFFSDDRLNLIISSPQDASKSINQEFLEKEYAL